MWNDIPRQPTVPPMPKISKYKVENKKNDKKISKRKIVNV